MYLNKNWAGNAEGVLEESDYQALATERVWGTCVVHARHGPSASADIPDIPDFDETSQDLPLVHQVLIGQKGPGTGRPVCAPKLGWLTFEFSGLVPHHGRNRTDAMTSRGHAAMMSIGDVRAVGKRRPAKGPQTMGGRRC